VCFVGVKKTRGLGTARDSGGEGVVMGCGGGGGGGGGGWGGGGSDRRLSFVLSIVEIPLHP